MAVYLLHSTSSHATAHRRFTDLISVAWRSRIDQGFGLWTILSRVTPLHIQVYARLKGGIERKLEATTRPSTWLLSAFTWCEYMVVFSKMTGSSSGEAAVYLYLSFPTLDSRSGPTNPYLCWKGRICLIFSLTN